MKRFALVSAGVVLVLMAGVADWSTKESTAQAVQIDQVSIAGVVVDTDSQRPEAGVGVIAETNSLPPPPIFAGSWSQMTRDASWCLIFQRAPMRCGSADMGSEIRGRAQCHEANS